MASVVFYHLSRTVFFPVNLFGQTFFHPIDSFGQNNLLVEQMVHILPAHRSARIFPKLLILIGDSGHWCCGRWSCVGAVKVGFADVGACVGAALVQVCFVSFVRVRVSLN
jgi:hypothetical protein